MRKAIAVIGEGITEKYYIDSLKGLSPFRIQPNELGKKASNIDKLEENIKKTIKDGYDELYCLIDMDGKKEGTVRHKYEKLKNRYHNQVHEIKNKGIKCNVVFIETERCTELWFLYHFTQTPITREFSSYSEIVKELQKYRPSYEKTHKYFKGVANLHKELTDKRFPNGSLIRAVKNSKISIKSKIKEGRNHTYSEMSILIEALGILTSQITVAYVEGDSTIPIGQGNKIILNICNDGGKWNSDFQKKISSLWSEPEHRYKEWFESNAKFHLGEVKFTKVEEDIWIANLIGQNLNSQNEDEHSQFYYEIISSGLKKISQFANEYDASVHISKNSYSFIDKNWENLKILVQEELTEKEIPVTVYNL